MEAHGTAIKSGANCRIRLTAGSWFESRSNQRSSEKTLRHQACLGMGKRPPKVVVQTKYAVKYPPRNSPEERRMHGASLKPLKLILYSYLAANSIDFIEPRTES